MGCNCKWTEIVLGLVILIVTIWDLFSAQAELWITIVAAALLVLHALACKNCGSCKTTGMNHNHSPASPKKRSSRRRRR